MPMHLNPPIRPAPARPALRFSRRSLLAAALVGCTRGIAPVAAPRDQTWALLSDTHIAADLAATVRGSCMAEHLRTAVADARAAAPDHVLINGDLALAAGLPADYAAFTQLIRPLRDIAPLHLVLGNHDHRANCIAALAPQHDAALADKLVSARVIAGAHWLFLDSLDVVNGVRGTLGRAQLDWLAKRLDEFPRTPAVVCVHHNPESSMIGLTDFQPLLDVLAPRRQTKLVLCGHTHEHRVWQSDGLHFVNLPAVAYPFVPGSRLGWLLATLLPGGARLRFRPVTTPAHEIPLTQPILHDAITSRPAPADEYELAWRNG